MPIPFFASFFQNFDPLLQTYRFGVVSERHDPGGFGRGLLRLSSEKYFLDFAVDGMGPKVAMMIGHNGQPPVDIAWAFAYLTRAHIISVPEAAGAPSPGLYFYPHLALDIWGEESVAWQAARLAEILQPLWAGIMIFLELEGPRSTEFLTFRKRIEQAEAERAADVYQLLPDAPAFSPERAALGFAQQAQKSFAFLSAYGYRSVQSTPLMVRFETAAAEGQPGPPLYISVFHRLHSYALGVHTGLVDESPGAELNFDMEELAAWTGVRYSPSTAQRAEELPAALNRLSRAFRRLAAPLLAGDTRLYQALLGRRIDAARRASRIWADRNRVS